MRNFRLESNEMRFSPNKKIFDILENSHGDYDVIMTWNNNETITIEQQP